MKSHASWSPTGSNVAAVWHQHKRSQRSKPHPGEGTPRMWDEVHHQCHLECPIVSDAVWFPVTIAYIAPPHGTFSKDMVHPGPRWEQYRRYIERLNQIRFLVGFLFFWQYAEARRALQDYNEPFSPISSMRRILSWSPIVRHLSENREMRTCINRFFYRADCSYQVSRIRPWALLRRQEKRSMGLRAGPGHGLCSTPIAIVKVLRSEGLDSGYR